MPATLHICLPFKMTYHLQELAVPIDFLPDPTVHDRDWRRVMRTYHVSQFDPTTHLLTDVDFHTGPTKYLLLDRSLRTAIAKSPNPAAIKADIQTARSRKIKVLGYVPTGHAFGGIDAFDTVRAVLHGWYHPGMTLPTFQNVKDDIDAWHLLQTDYGIHLDGIYLDEGPCPDENIYKDAAGTWTFGEMVTTGSWQHGDVKRIVKPGTMWAFYRDTYEYVTQKWPAGIFSEPGTVLLNVPRADLASNSIYQDIFTGGFGGTLPALCDAAVLFEGPYSDYLNVVVPAWADDFRSQTLHIVHSVPPSDLATMQQVKAHANALGIENVSITSSNGKPYSQIPDFWESEVDWQPYKFVQSRCFRLDADVRSNLLELAVPVDSDEDREQFVLRPDLSAEQAHKVGTMLLENLRRQDPVDEQALRAIEQYLRHYAIDDAEPEAATQA